jgi:uncharacterized protein YyaL (SSP411 family)
MSSQTLNQLEGETSPYLLEHADNPVDWYPWCDEAIQRARDEDKPIFLSIGYSACHWCHVMKRESFEDPETAEILNEHFISIKVDREERPDLDEIYMNAVQSMTGRGGWPMSVFLTPDLKPFYGGTYFPPEPRQGMPAFKEVLQRIRDTYQQKREDVEDSADQLSEQLERIGRTTTDGDVPEPELLRSAYDSLKGRFDDKWGGFGDAPKFPRPMDLQLLTRLSQHESFEKAGDMLKETLDSMMYGGIYDQVGGGFSRYSTDRQWLVPHFEKMLYDNAQLIDVYTVAYRLFGDNRHGRVVRQTIEYVRREMTSPEGGFYSTQNAESEGEEGKYYVWDYDEFLDTVEDQPELVAEFFGITEEGNFEGKNILHVSEPLESFCQSNDLEPASYQRTLWSAVENLLEAREHRIKPERDEKILADWNGLMAAAHARAGFYLDEPEYVKRAEQCLEFVLDHHYEDELLHHVHKEGNTHTAGFLDDYAFMIKALLETFQASGHARWLRRARSMFEGAVERFWDEDSGGFYFTDDQHDDLLVRSKNPQDKAQPSGNSEMIVNAVKLSALTGQHQYMDYASETLGAFGELMDRAPDNLTRMLCGLYDYHVPPVEIITIDEAGSDSELIDPVRNRFFTSRVVFPTTPEGPDVDVSSVTDNRLDVDEPTAYVCSSGRCQTPVHSPDDVEEQISTMIRDRENPFEE